ncbi:hypothetical protein PanWU01x14_354440, partial [Parasponia andersonii]
RLTSFDNGVAEVVAGLRQNGVRGGEEEESWKSMKGKNRVLSLSWSRGQYPMGF